MSGIERCPHCVIPPMRPYTNGFGGAYLMCLDCGYAESITARVSPHPDRIYRGSSGRMRRVKGEERPIVPRKRRVA